MTAAALIALALVRPGAVPPVVRVRLGQQGDILAWLVAGPFPNDGALERRGTGFRTDYLSGESTVDPVEGSGWRLAVGTRRNGLDLNAVMGNGKPANGYAFTILDSPRAQEAVLKFGSDDGAKVFVNGQLVFERQIARGIRRDEETVRLPLRAGPNRLLFKIEQGDGGWGLMARMAAGAGLQTHLSLDPASRDGASLRKVANTAGSLDLETLSSFEALQTSTRRWLDRFRKELKAPDRLATTLAESQASVLQALSMGADATSTAATGGLARLSREFRAARAPMLAAAQRPTPLLSVDPKRESFITKLRSGRYFADDAGRPFLAIGANHNLDWPELEESNPLADRYEPVRTDRWFRKLRDKGVTVVRLMVETPQSGNLEERVGVFRPEHVRWLDNVVLAARRHSVRLMVTPYDTFWMNLRADASPYWAENGGPVVKKIDFLTKPSVIAAQRRRMHFLIDRYGNLGTIFAWEPMNEIDLWWGATPAQIRAWVDNVVADARAYQLKRWGRPHLVTISMAAALPKGGNADTAFRRPDLDFATMHVYLGKSRAPSEGDEIQSGLDYADGVAYARAQTPDGRPVFDGESGPIDRWVRDESLDNRVFAQMSWSHLFAGGAGSGLRWPYRQPHVATPGMLETLSKIRAFSDAIPWQSFGNAVATRDRDFRRLGDRRAMIAWRTAAATLLALPAGKWSVREFDMAAGKWGKARLARGQISLPDPATPVAVLAVRTGA